MHPMDRPTLISAAVAVCALAALIVTLDIVKSRRSLNSLSVPDLVKMYQRGGGGEDYAGPELKKRGDPARDELIRMLDATPLAGLDGDTTATIGDILRYHFPSQASSDALDRLRARVTDPVTQSEFRERAASLRAKISGQPDQAWWKEHQAMSPLGQGLHSEELLMANAVPADRVFFLVQAANFALWDGNETKAEAYAREALATPDFAAKCADGVYEVHHVLGLLALKRGDIAGAKHHMFESAKATSWRFGALEGPDPDLTEPLVARGERDAVFEYLDLFKTSPERGALVERWKEAIRAGKTPNVRLEWTMLGLSPKERGHIRRQLQKGGMKF